MTEPINWGALVEQAGGDFEPLPKGDYDVRVDTAEATMSTTQKLMFKLKLKVASGPHVGRTLWNNITLTTDNPNALRMFFMNMKAFGLEPEFFNANPAPEVVAANLVNKQVRVKVDHQTYNGQIRENIKSIMPPLGVSPQGVVPTPGVAAPAAGPAIPQPGAVPATPAPTPTPTPTPAPTPAAAPAAPTPEPAAPTPAPAAVETPVPTPEPAPAVPQPEAPSPAASPTPPPVPF